MNSEVESLRRELRALCDREKIRQLLYRYARGVDRADADLIRSVYAPGGTDQHGPYNLTGEEFADIIVQGARKVWDSVGNHHITNIFVELDGDHARAETYFLALHPQVDHGDTRMAVISGRYLDVLERHDGEWGILRRVVVSDWTRDDVDGLEWARSSEGAGYLGGRRGRTDASYEFFGAGPPTAGHVATRPTAETLRPEAR